MKAKGWIVRHRFLLANGLLLSACVFGLAERLHAQREVIATAAPVSNATPAPVSPPSGIQPVSYVPNATPAPSPSPRPLLGLPSSVSSEQPVATPSAPPAVPTASTESLVSVEVVGPERLPQGQPLKCEIVLRNRGAQPLAEIHVEEPLPAGVGVLRTDPLATTHDNRLAWDLRDLEAGGERRLKVELNLSSLRELDLKPYVTLRSGHGLRTCILRPPFRVEMSADPVSVPRGGPIRFRIQLANNGDETIHNLKLYDTLPAGLHHPQGPKVGIEQFGDLAPGETRTLTLEATAVAPGPFRNEFLAQADFGVQGKAVVEGVVTEPSLSLRVDGPKQTDTLHEVDFRLEVANPAALAARNVRLVQTFPPTFEVVSASSGASLDSTRHALVWSLSDLKAGERQTVMFRGKASVAGDWPLTTAVLSPNLAETRIESMLHVEGSALLKLELQAREERLAVGVETMYRLHVFNNGDAPCTGLRLTAVLPEAVTPTKTEGPGEGRVDKQQVRFAPLPRLEGRSDVVYRIHVRGRQPGKGILSVELASDKQAPITKEISIQVDETARTATNPPSIERTKFVPGETLR
jgi:uncharacterized repeat protein (TIGR01451 family)